MWYTMEYYSVIKKNEIIQFATTWMDLEGIMLSEISQPEKDKYCMLYMESKKKKKKNDYKQTETDSKIQKTN